MSSSEIGRDVHSLISSVRHFLCRPRRRPPSKVSRRMVLQRLLWRATCSNHARFPLLTVARRSSCGPTRKLILFRIQSLVLCSKWEIRRSFLGHLVSKSGILFLESTNRVYVSQPYSKCVVAFSAVLKHTIAGSRVPLLEFETLESSSLCVVTHLKQHLKATPALRKGKQLFRSLV